MLIVKNKRYINKHVVGGAGIFDTISNFFKSDAAKVVGKELAMTAIDKGKQLINKIPNKPSVITQKSKDVLASLAAKNSEVTLNLNRLLAGQGLNTNKVSAVKIQDLVKKNERWWIETCITYKKIIIYL